MSAPLRIAVVGYGHWGKHWPRVFAATPGAEVTWVCDRSAEALRKAPLDVRKTDDFHDVLVASDVDAVVVMTPPSAHYAVARKAMQAGKHVLVAKPLALSSDDVDALTQGAVQCGVVLAVDHTYAFNGMVRAAVEAVATGEIGEPRCYESTRANLGRYQRDVNVLWDLAVHDLSILEVLGAGEPLSVSAVGQRVAEASQVDLARMSVTYESGLVAHIACSWLSPRKVRRITVTSSIGALVLDESATNRVVAHRIGARPDGSTWGDESDALEVDNTEALAVEAANFVACCRDKVAPIVGGAEAERAVRVLEASTESMRFGGAPVNL